MKISIVIPAHNEEDNLPILIENIWHLIKKNRLNSEIILVDDNSNDSTPEICDKFKRRYDNVFTIHRVGNPGMGNALIEGTKKAKGDVVIWIMADLSDDLNTIPKFLERIDNGYDLVFGSRYIKGGSPGDIPYNKTIFSKSFTILSRIFTGIKVHDITNAFRAFKKNIFYKVKPASGDFAISPEFALKAHLAKFRLSEIPTIYKNRKKGVTKFKMFKMSIRYLSVFLSVLLQKLIS